MTPEQHPGRRAEDRGGESPLNQLTRSVESLAADVRYLTCEVEELRGQRAAMLWLIGFLMVVAVIVGDIAVNWWLS